MRAASRKREAGASGRITDSRAETPQRVGEGDDCPALRMTGRWRGADAVHDEALAHEGHRAAAISVAAVSITGVAGGAAPPALGPAFGHHAADCARATGFSGEHNPGMHSAAAGLGRRRRSWLSIVRRPTAGSASPIEPSTRLRPTRSPDVHTLRKRRRR